MKATLVILVGFLLTSSAANSCPSPESLSPCICSPNDPQEVACRNIAIDDGSFSLRTISAKINASGDEQIFDNFALESTSATEIEDAIFPKLVFKKISILANAKLAKIDVNAFVTSLSITEEIFICTNPILFSELGAERDLFNLLSNFTKVRRITVRNGGLKLIPDGAFQLSSNGVTNSELVYLDFSKNQIQSVGQKAFARLPSLEVIILSHNQIAKIEPAAFYRDSVTTRNRLVIDLTGNSLSPSSFEEESLTNYTHAVTLNIAENQLQYLDPNLFGPFLMGDVLVNLTGNGIECRDCKHKWLYVERDCRKRVATRAKLIQGIECDNDQSMSIKDFENCTSEVVENFKFNYSDPNTVYCRGSRTDFLSPWISVFFIMLAGCSS